MLEADKKPFAELMIATAEIYGKSLSKSLLKIYFQSLNGYEFSDVQAAVEAHLLTPKEGTFFPKPADIVSHIDGASQSSEDRAVIAWMAVERAIDRVGAYGNIKLDDKQALLAIQHMGSWQQLCHTDREKLAFKRNEFLACYRSLGNTPVELLPQSLAGIEALSNQRKGLNQASALVDRLAKRQSNLKLVGTVA